MCLLSFSLYPTKGNDIDFRPCAIAEGNEAAHPFADVQHLCSFYVCARPFWIDPTDG